MDERHRSLTPRERQEFEEIRARLSQEMPEVEPGPLGRLRWSTPIATGMAAIGVMLLIVGLLSETITVAFVGFVAVLVGAWRLSLRADPGRWRMAVGGWLRPDASGPSRPPGPQ